ncbi:exodeoxyribonuclease VII small subunit [Suttonella ornithocola]|uniref:Exodeoxyribonuclease 7 small subunit n=1 Tax=Suttonella ornithocola TaxID=279832 RepID=A0A380MYB1_9GAMM|nr:exodeoxyribonuclease VII small subunit [Suttonella ornithocola]SUO97292.1 Exodeoxyribonuclease 7 small subunit [Suttonella ornithocola]
MSQKDPLSQYEKNIENLENIIQALEEGELTLDNALKQYEKGMSLIRQCQQALETAEQKIQILSQNSEEETLLPFNHESVDSTIAQTNRSNKNDDDFSEDDIPL